MCPGQSSYLLTKVEDLYFLHLSDIHIAKCLNRTLYKLVDDIAIQLKNVRYLIIVVTGDLACAGAVEDAADLIVFFFEKIRDSIPGNCQVLDVELTPGNHDVKRPEEKNKYNNKTYRYINDEYLALAERIRNIFRPQNKFQLKRCSRKTSGITVLQYGVHNICIVRVDSSWFATRDELCQRLFKKSVAKQDALTVRQSKIIDSIMRQMEVAATAQSRYLKRHYEVLLKKFKRFDLTIAISHYPITWMLKSCEQSVRGFLEYSGMSDVDIWMCGHTHTAQMYFNNENNRSTTMLMTGIGRPDYECQDKSYKRQDRVNNDSYQLQRYSIYQISHERNICSVLVRVSKRGGSFLRDDKFYQSKLSYDYNYLCLPLKTEIPGGFIRLNSFDDREAKGLYVDYPVLSSVKEIGQRMVVFNERMQKEMAEQFEFLRFILNLTRGYSDKFILQKFINSYTGFQDDLNRRWKVACSRAIIKLNLFKEFLDVLGSNLIEVFTQNSLFELPWRSEYAENKDFQSIGWRVHFRRYEGKVSSDRKVILDDVFTAITNTGDAAYAKVVPWGGLISGAMKHEKHCLIHSAANICNHIPTGWSDFLTAVPIFGGNVIDLELLDNNCPKRPLLTFAISMKISRYEESVIASKMLYILEFFNINYVVSRIIQAYFAFFGFENHDIQKIIRRVQ